MSLLRKGKAVDPNSRDVWKTRILTSGKRLRPNIEELNRLFGRPRNRTLIQQMQSLGRTPPPCESWWNLQYYRINPTGCALRISIRSETEVILYLDVNVTVSPQLEMQVRIAAPPDPAFHRRLLEAYARHHGVEYQGATLALSNFDVIMELATPITQLGVALREHPLYLGFPRTQKIEKIYQYLLPRLLQFKCDVVSNQTGSFPPCEFDFPIEDLTSTDYPIREE